MNIVVLAGGLSTERDVSFKSGDGMAKALRRLGHKAILLDVFMGYKDSECDITDLFDRDEEVSCIAPDIPKTAPDLAKIKASRKDKSDVFFGPNVIALCKAADLVFIGLHGENGENGKVQAALDLYGVKYTGSDYVSCAMSMDKSITKTLLEAAGVSVPDGFRIDVHNRNNCDKKPSFPCVVKPASGGSSIGMSIVYREEDYESALDLAFSTDNAVLVEQYIKGREFTKGVLGGQALPSVEAVPVDGTFDYANKYTAGATVETCPADIPEVIEAEMSELAIKAADAVGMQVYCRVDFMQDESTGKLYALEVNALPGMTPTSFLPQEAKVIGLSYDELIDRILKLSLEKYNL